MARVLVIEADATAPSFVAGALEGAGHSVDLGVERELTRAGGYDALVTDLDVAIRVGWFRPGAPLLDVGCPVVVTSRFAAFLASVADRVAATILTPASSEAVVRAVEDAIARTRTTLSPLLDPLDDAARDARVAELTAPDSELTAIADLVARGLGTTMGLVTVLTSSTQHFIGQVGLPADLADAGGTPRSWSFCQHAVTAGATLVVEDSRQHPVLAQTPLAEMGLVRAYAGVPIEIDGTNVGTVCVLSDAPRIFDSQNIATLQLAARLVASRLSRYTQARAPKISLTPTLTEAPPPSRALQSISVSDPLGVGSMLDGKYWITTRLGGGSLSEVLLARDRMLGQLVAIKVMRTRDDDAPPVSRRKTRSGDADLLREATALAKVRHPNIVQVQGWGRTKRAQIYLVLEYVEGRTLEDRLAAASSGAEPFDVRYALQIVQQLGGALATLHAAGIIHGDIKPDNVMLDLSLDRAVLIDFGLALGGDDRGGTPGYSAPEQFSLDVDLKPTPALDVYGLGAIAYAMLVGQAPFGEVRGLARVAAQRRNELTLPSVARPGLPRNLDAVLLRALALDPDERFDSMLGFTDALEDAIAGTPGGSLPTARAREASTPSSRGSAFRRLRSEVQRRLGIDTEETIVDALAPADRDVVRGAIDERTWYPTSALAAYLAGATAGDLAMIEDLAITTTTQILPELLKSAGVTRTPATLLHIAAPLVYRFHDWGKLAIVRSGSHDATLSVTMPKGYAPIMCRVVSGALIALLRTASANAHVTQTRCMAEGADACELKVTWAA
ncbi:MAG: hypothetical protein JWM74_940 [Myxococcaceae bacterium]|nr:hypothetical protein [Myxococcaceae bacterium]